MEMLKQVQSYDEALIAFELLSKTCLNHQTFKYQYTDLKASQILCEVLLYKQI